MKSTQRLSDLKTMSPDRIAPLAVYLVSDAAMMISNQIFGVQGSEISRWCGFNSF